MSVKVSQIGLATKTLKAYGISINHMNYNNLVHSELIINTPKFQFEQISTLTCTTSPTFEKRTNDISPQIIQIKTKGTKKKLSAETN